MGITIIAVRQTKHWFGWELTWYRLTPTGILVIVVNKPGTISSMPCVYVWEVVGGAVCDQGT
jgi:hypothetical protein